MLPEENIVGVNNFRFAAGNYVGRSERVFSLFFLTGYGGSLPTKPFYRRWVLWISSGLISKPSIICLIESGRRTQAFQLDFRLAARETSLTLNARYLTGFILYDFYGLLELHMVIFLTWNLVFQFGVEIRYKTSTVLNYIFTPSMLKQEWESVSWPWIIYSKFHESL